MDCEARNLQDEFFNAARKQRTTLTVFLENGKRLIGRLKSFDKFTLLLEGQQGEQMVFKHAISTVSVGARAGAAQDDEAESDRTIPAAGREAFHRARD